MAKAEAENCSCVFGIYAVLGASAGLGHGLSVRPSKIGWSEETRIDMDVAE